MMGVLNFPLRKLVGFAFGAVFLLPGCKPAPEVESLAPAVKQADILPASPELVAEETARMVSRMGAQVLRNEEGLIHSVVMTDLPVNNSILIPLKELVDLEVLSLSGTRITNSGMVHLTGFDRLTYLFMNDTAVTDEGLLALADSVALRYISLDNTNVTVQGVDEFRRLSPGTVVQHSPRSTTEDPSATGSVPRGRGRGRDNAASNLDVQRTSDAVFTRGENLSQNQGLRRPNQQAPVAGVRLRYRGEPAPIPSDGESE